MKLHNARRSTRFPRRVHRPLGILGPHGRQQKLARLSFGKIKIPLTRDEFAAINERAEAYLRSNGTLFGFVRHLLNA